MPQLIGDRSYHNSMEISNRRARDGYNYFELRDGPFRNGDNGYDNPRFRRSTRNKRAIQDDNYKNSITYRFMNTFPDNYNDIKSKHTDLSDFDFDDTITDNFLPPLVSIHVQETPIIAPTTVKPTLPPILTPSAANPSIPEHFQVFLHRFVISLW